MLRTTRGVSETKTYGRQEVIEEYGVTPEQIPDYKALVGDPSDNIPGVRGIGPKGAANLLQEFDSVDGVYENLDDVSAKGTRKKLEEGRESAFISLELARMRFDAPVGSTGRRSNSRACRPRSVTCSSGATSSGASSPDWPSYPSRGGRVCRRWSGWRYASPRSPSSQASSPWRRRRSGTAAVGVAVAEDEVRVSEGLPDRPLRVHDAKKAGVGGRTSTRSWLRT